MWRSIAAKSSELVRRLGIPNKVPTSPSLTLSPFQSRIPSWASSESLASPQSLRFFSHSPANPTETEIFNDSEVNLAEFNDTQLGNSATEGGISGFSENFGASGENGDTQMGQFASGNENVEMEEEEKVYEIDMEKLESVLSLLQSSIDGSLESSLDSMDLDLHEDFVVKVLETPRILGENLIGFFEWATKKMNIGVTTREVDALVRAICSDLRKKDAYKLWDLLREIADKENDVVNVESLNQLVALFSKLGKGKAALEVFNTFDDFSCAPDSDTYYFTIEALCRRSIFHWAWSVCDKMLNAGALPDNEKVGKIISWLCKGNLVEGAHSVYMLAKQNDKHPPRSAVNFLINSLCRKDETVRLAMEMLDHFSGEARKYAINPFSSVVRGLCRIKDVDGARKLLDKMIAEGPPPGNAVFNSVINGYSKSGDMREAIDMMKVMENRGLKPDVYTYTIIMSGYASGGQIEEARKILLEAKKKYSKLSPVTYHTLIRGYCKLERFDEALELLAEMKDYGVHPSLDEYNKLIQSLCLKALDWGKAEKLLNEMEENGLCLNGITRGLIRAVKELEEEGLEEEVKIEA